jgi:hypothetical protein
MGKSCVHARKHISQGDLPTTKESDTSVSPCLKFDQSQERHILNNPIGNLGNMGKGENVQPIVLSQ